MTRVEIVVPPTLWLTSNRHPTDLGRLASTRRGLHTLAAWCARAQGLPACQGPVHVEWEVRYPRGVRLDKGEASNAQPTTKALLDGLVPAWLPDDGPRWVLSEHFRRGPNLDVSGVHMVTLTLTEA